MNKMLILLTTLSLTACSSGTRLLEAEKPIMTSEPVASSSDENLDAHVDWVVIRNGGGSWASDADWDEYMIRTRNVSAKPVKITSVKLVDSTGEVVHSEIRRKKLVKGTKAALRRHKDLGLKVKAGASGGSLLLASGGVYVASGAIGMSALAGSGMAVAAAPVAVGGIIIATPVLLTSGLVKSVREARVEKELLARASSLPHPLVTSDDETLSVFFPITPSPNTVVIRYEQDGATRDLHIDVSEQLGLLHIVNVEGE